MNEFKIKLIKFLKNKKVFVLFEILCYVIAMKGIIKLVIYYIKNDMFDLGAIIIVAFLLAAIYFIMWMAYKVFKMNDYEE